MVFTRLIRPDVQDDVDRIFNKSARAKPAKRLMPSERTKVPVEVKKPRLTSTQIAAKRSAEVQAAGEAKRLEAERVAEDERREAKRLAAIEHRASEEKRLLDIVRSSSQPIVRRIDTAISLGFDIARRAPENRPRHIIFRSSNGSERIRFSFPRGKNARYEFVDVQPNYAAMRQHGISHAG